MPKMRPLSIHEAPPDRGVRGVLPPALPVATHHYPVLQLQAVGHKFALRHIASSNQQQHCWPTIPRPPT